VCSSQGPLQATHRGPGPLPVAAGRGCSRLWQRRISSGSPTFVAAHTRWHVGARSLRRWHTTTGQWQIRHGDGKYGWQCSDKNSSSSTTPPPRPPPLPIDADPASAHGSDCPIPRSGYCEARKTSWWTEAIMTTGWTVATGTQ